MLRPCIIAPTSFVIWDAFREALASYDKVLAIRPGDFDALYNRGITLQDLNRFQEAQSSYERALEVKPNHKYALDGLFRSALGMCDWKRTAKFIDELENGTRKQKSFGSPFTLLACCDNASLQLECAKNYMLDQFPKRPRTLSAERVDGNRVIRIAYLSADFRQHPIAFLLKDLFDLHDRSRFEVMGLSFGHDDGSKMRERLVKSFDRFEDVRSKSDLQVALFLKDLQVDIAIDLMGYMRDFALVFSRIVLHPFR